MRKKRQERQKEESLLEEIANKERLLSENSIEVLQEIDALKREYDHIQSEKAQGVIIRSKADWTEFGEKIQSIFYS